MCKGMSWKYYTIYNKMYMCNVYFFVIFTYPENLCTALWCTVKIIHWLKYICRYCITRYDIFLAFYNFLFCITVFAFNYA